MKNKIKIHLVTYVMALLFVSSGYINYLLIFLFILTVHELGHLLMIRFLGYQVEEICIYPCGGVIKTNLGIMIPSSHLFFISISGVLGQLLLFFLVPKSIGYNYSIFLFLNKSLVLFNLLPIIPLDGYKIYLSLFENLFPYRMSVKLSYMISFVGLLVWFYFTKSLYIFVFLYLFNVQFFLQFPFYMNKFFLERYLYGSFYKKRKNILSLKNAYKCRNNYVKCGTIYLEEKEVLKKMFQSFY